MEPTGNHAPTVPQPDAEQEQQAATKRGLLSRAIGSITKTVVQGSQGLVDGIVEKSLKEDLHKLDRVGEQAGDAPFWKSDPNDGQKDPIEGHDRRTFRELERSLATNEMVSRVESLKHHTPHSRLVRTADKHASPGKTRADHLKAKGRELADNLIDTPSLEIRPGMTQRQVEQRQRWAAALDPENVLELKKLILDRAENRAVGRAAVQKRLNHGGITRISPIFVAAYFGVDQKTWYKITHQESDLAKTEPVPPENMIPIDVIRKFKQLSRQSDDVLKNLAAQRTPVARDSSPIKDAREKEQEEAVALNRVNSKGKTRLQEIDDAQKATSEYHPMETPHKIRVEELRNRQAVRQERATERARKEWPMIKYSPEQVRILLKIDKEVEDSIFAKVQAGEFAEKDRDFGEKCAEVRATIYRKYFETPLRTFSDEEVMQTYQDIKRIKAVQVEHRTVLDAAREAIIREQFGSEWLIRKEVKLPRTATGKNGTHQVEIDLTPEQSRYIMTELESEGIVGPRVKEGQRREVLVDPNGNPKAGA